MLLRASAVDNSHQPQRQQAATATGQEHLTGVQEVRRSEFGSFDFVKTNLSFPPHLM
jgi:hypothetical protein